MHAEVYGLSGSLLKAAKRAKEGTKRKQGSGGWSAREIMAEALREPQASRHVPHPKPPEILYGDPIEVTEEIEKLTKDLEETKKARPGHRRDTPVLMACIASAPWPPGDTRSIKWREDVIRHFKKKYGNYFKAAIGHSDEPHDHLHLYVALHGYAPIKTIHPGMNAREIIKAQGGKGYELEAEYNREMIKWQDEYYEQVGIFNAQTRIGPGKQRLTHVEWLVQKAGAEHSAMALRVIDRARESARAEAEEIKAKARLVEAEALEAAATFEMQAVKVRAEVNSHAESEELRLVKVKESLDAERARQADERARQADEQARLADQVERLKKAQEANRAKAADLIKSEEFLQVQVQEVAKKSSILDGLLTSFYSTMTLLHQRMTHTDKGAIEHLLSAVDQIKAKFNWFAGKGKEKAKSGLDLD